MNDFKSEVLPSGMVIEKCGDDFLIGEKGRQLYTVVKLSRSDINRMHGIAFPEKRLSEKCCNAPQQTDIPATNAGDMPLHATGDKYEAEVLRIAEVLAITNYREMATAFIPENTWESLDDYAKEISISSQMAVAYAIVSEMNTAHYKGFITGLAAKDQFPNDDENSIIKRNIYYKSVLVERGLIPATVLVYNQDEDKVIRTKDWGDYPIGTRAYATMGGYWEKVGGPHSGWKWCTGATFPTPGGDTNGLVSFPRAGTTSI